MNSKIVSEILSRSKNKSIVTVGCDSKQIEILMKYGITISNKVSSFDHIDRSVDAYYVVNSEINPSIRELMNRCDIKLESCFFLKHKVFTIAGEGAQDYEDEYGNLVSVRAKNIKITIFGTGNHIFVGDTSSNVNIHIVVTSNCSIEIGSKFKGNNCFINAKENSTLYIGEDCSFFGNSFINVYEKGSISIGNHCEVGEEFRITSTFCGKIAVGNHCLFSRNIRFLSNDGHAIFDINTIVFSNDSAVMFLITSLLEWISAPPLNDILANDTAGTPW